MCPVGGTSLGKWGPMSSSAGGPPSMYVQTVSGISLYLTHVVNIVRGIQTTNSPGASKLSAAGGGSMFVVGGTKTAALLAPSRDRSHQQAGSTEQAGTTYYLSHPVWSGFSDL